MKKMQHFQSIRKLFHLARSTRFLTIFALLALMFTVLLEGAGTLLIRHVIDKVFLRDGGIKLVALFTLLYIAIAAIRSLGHFISSRGMGKTAENVAKTLRENLYDHIQRLSFSYHDRNQTGELLQRVTSDVDMVRRFFAEHLSGITGVFFLFSINFGILLFLHAPLALLSSLMVPISACLSIVFFNLISKAYVSYQEQEERLTSRVQENLSGIRIVRAFARQSWEKERFAEINAEQYRKGITLLSRHAYYWPLSHTLCGLQSVITILVGGMMVIDGEITPGTFVAFFAMVNAMIWPLEELGQMVIELSKSLVSYARIQEILNEEQEEIGDGIVQPSLRGDISFRNLSFSYEGGPEVLREIDLEVESGKRIALLGTTGSGKTTLVSLLPRYYDVPSESIYLDGKPIESYSKHFLRQNIGVVEQQPFLFAMSIRDNIAFSVERSVEQEEIEEAARAAHIHDAILSFPDGYDTMLGEKGVNLSGGQKQRIIIARTILKDPQILILDDSTSSVDAETEEHINHALDQVMEGRTTFIIAHRIQTLMRADHILVMQDGRIVEQGSHNTLLQENGFYQEIFSLQTKIEDDLQKELNQAGVNHR